MIANHIGQVIAIHIVVIPLVTIAIAGISVGKVNASVAVVAINPATHVAMMNNVLASSGFKTTQSEILFTILIIFSIKGLIFGIN